jgi:hypothetical protein
MIKLFRLFDKILRSLNYNIILEVDTLNNYVVTGIYIKKIGDKS